MAGSPSLLHCPLSTCHTSHTHLNTLMYIYVHIHLYTHAHTHAHTFMHHVCTHIHALMYTCTHIFCPFVASGPLELTIATTGGGVSLGSGPIFLDLPPSMHCFPTPALAMGYIG